MMKIKTRDIGLLAAGFILGVVVTASLSTTPTRSPSAPASTSIFFLPGPTLASASHSGPFKTVTNIQWQAPPVHIVLPLRAIESTDPQRPLFPPSRTVLDLIDTRYKPDIKLDDLE